MQSGYNPLDLPAQQRAQEATELERKVQKDREASDFRWLLNHKQGRRLMWKWLGEAGIFHSSFGGGNDATNFREGTRVFGLKLLNEIQTLCPERFGEMMVEARQQEKTEHGRSISK